jgi:uncharacterized membrane protein
MTKKDRTEEELTPEAPVSGDEIITETGAPVSDGPAEAGATETRPSENNEPTTLHERSIAALSYIGFLAIVPFYLKKDSKFCRFHGKQGLLLAILFYFCKLLMVLDVLMDLVLVLQFFVFVIMGFAALSGRWKKLPYIYESACKLEKSLSIDEGGPDATKQDPSEQATNS